MPLYVSQSDSQILMPPAKKCSRSSVGPMRLAKSTTKYLRAPTEPIHMIIAIKIIITNDKHSSTSTLKSNIVMSDQGLLASN